MQYRVSLTARAVKDLDSIFQFIQTEQSEKAATWFNGLQRSPKDPLVPCLTERPPHPKTLLFGTSSTAASKPNIYRVIYLTDDTKKTVTVLTIRHGARKPIRIRRATQI